MDYDYLKYKKILIVDDEADLREMVTSILAQDGFKTIRTAGTVAEALKICRDWEPDLAILDVMLPDGDGFSLFEQMRTFTEVPVLFLTARGEDEDKLKGLGLGADDYMVKPIDLDELLLRIGALLRRAKIAVSKKLTVGNLILNAEERSACLGEEEISLTVREFNLLYKLLSYPKKTFTRSQLMDEFWDSDTSSGPRTVDVYMTKLRDKFSGCDDFEIVTVHGLGYKAVIK